YLVLFLLLAMSLQAMPEQGSTADSLRTDKEITMARKLRFEQLRKNNPNWSMPDIKPFDLKLSLNLFDYRELMKHDLFQISMEMYDKYYKKDIPLWKFRDSASLQLDLRNLQNNQGLLQFELLLPNYPLFMRGELKRRAILP
ncbi:MAG: hypothetical protein U1C33_04240, partial [Candidatus Cloacimonadaceae bacterium]|nr:hypothetical protein [Candidatus Cloacimonadaceae bacterium]